MIRHVLLALPLFIGMDSHAQMQAAAPALSPAAFLAAAENAEKIADPLQRCLEYPDLPGNTWPRDQAQARCRLFNTPPPFTLDAIDAALKNGDAKRVDATLRKIEGDRLFIALAPFKSTARADDAERIARAWLKAAPESAHARTALGLVLANRGWNARGTDYAGNTSDSKLRSMEAYFDDAKLQFETVLAKQPRLIVACESLMAIGRQTSDALQASATSRCLEAEPASFYVVEEMMTNAEPRWGGSLAQMREVVGYARSQMDKNPLLEILVYEPDAYPASETDDPDEQIAGFEPLALRVASPGYLGRAGCAMARSEDPAIQQKALVYLSESLRFWPDGQCELMNRAQLLMNSGQHAWALRDAERGLALDPSNAWWHGVAADLLRSLERSAEALPHLKLAMADPEYHDGAAYSYCLTLIEAQRHDDAVACTRTLVDEQPMNAEAWRLRLNALDDWAAPGSEEAMRHFLATQDSARYPWHEDFAKMVREYMAAHDMKE